MYLSAALILMHLPFCLGQGVGLQHHPVTSLQAPAVHFAHIQSIGPHPQFSNVRFPGLSALSLSVTSEGRSEAGKLVADSTNPPKTPDAQQSAPLGRINLGTAPSSEASIQPLPRPSLEARRSNHVWLALAAAQHSAAAFDAWSTRRAIDRGYSENDPLMRPFAHSPAMYATIQIIPLGFDWLSMRMMRSSHGWMRKTWWLPQAVATAGYLFSGAHNLTMGR